MSEEKHTKLPWYVHRRNPLVLQASDGNIALMNLARPSEESEANAAFIARACNSHKELLEALKELRRDWLQHSYSGDGCELGRKVLAAIHKATGAA
jgi:hypothetical protein